jgi:pimeloyl-ACP methyl ester carboxylesterase
MAAARAALADGSVVVGHSMGAVIALRLAAEPGRSVRAVVLSGCFFPPARNGRTVPASVADYARHRIAFVAEARRRPATGGPRRGTAGALGSLVRLALRPAGFDALAGAVRAPVLVVHARDDHHVPVDFARAAAARRPAWTLRVLDRGGHHAHVDDPAAWLSAVVPWLRAL